MVGIIRTGTVVVDGFGFGGVRVWRSYPARHNGRVMEMQVFGEWVEVQDDRIAQSFRTDAELADEARLTTPEIQGVVTLANSSKRVAWHREGNDLAYYRTSGGRIREISATAFVAD